MVCNMKKTIHKIWLDTCGQGTVEFAVVTAAFLCIVIALFVLWDRADSGMFIEHALGAASHHVQEAFLGIVGDVFSC